MVRVLIVDDMEIARVLISQACKLINVDEVVVARSGSDAWAQLQDNSHFDAIISDCMMPGLSGEQLLEKVRSDEKYKDVPFILVTSESEREQIIKLTKMGANAYICKPFSVDSLAAELQKALASKLAGRKGA